MAYFELRPTCASPDYPIYGAEWAGTSDPSWTRTDAASSFSDPNPYYAGMSTTPSSPFDNISPWKDLVVSEDSEAGTLVSIPKFYFKWTRTGDKMKLQISMHQYDGFFVSPAHADRGDGKGERDVVYVGRYHCASDYKSKTGVTPANNISLASFRSSIHNLGTTIWQQDYAMFWTIRMLYLVEFAHWNAQAKIGYGCGNNSSIENEGYTDSMPYHTGTTQSSRTTYGIGTQYRRIEGLWSGAFEWIDGFFISSNNIYIIKNPSEFSDDTKGIFVGALISGGSGQYTAFTAPSTTGVEYALTPSGSTLSTANYDTYCCDGYNKGGSRLYIGAHYEQSLMRGMFFYGMAFSGEAVSGRGSRLIKLP